MSDPVWGSYWRVKWASIGAVVALVLVGLAWLLTSVVKSPQDALAEAAPPPPSRITVRVEQKALDLDVSVPGTVVRPRTVSGTLSVDDRDKADKTASIKVSAPGAVIGGTLTEVEADGAFTLKLAEALEVGETVTIEFLPGKQAEVLVVPISALFTGADGGTDVVVVDKGVETQVSVRMGVEAAGFVEITPVKSGSVVEGDNVLVSEPTS